MKISTKGRYALRMMLDLAEHQQDGYIALKDIARRQGISKKYLEQIVPMLTRAEYLLTSRGFAGGYRLAKAPDKYSAYDILKLTEGSLCPVACLEDGAAPCERSCSCPTLILWKGLDRAIHEYLAGITLQDLIEQSRAQYGNDYII